jgi:hypothetical protein
VGYRRHRNRKDGKQRHQKLLFAAWRVHGSPTEIREAIPPALRHRNELSPNAAGSHLHLHAQSSPAAVFLAVALILRNIWVWIHLTRLAEGSGDKLTLAPGTVAIQAYARLDRPRNRRPISRRLNTLRRSATLNQTWNY